MNALRTLGTVSLAGVLVMAIWVAGSAVVFAAKAVAARQEPFVSSDMPASRQAQCIDGIMYFTFQPRGVNVEVASVKIDRRTMLPETCEQ